MSKNFVYNEDGEKVYRRQAVCVLAKDGTPLMPTHRNDKVTKWLENGEAIIVCHHPFTIQLMRETKKYTQPIEITLDTGTRHVGFSVKSKTSEYFSEQRDLLTGEKENLDDRRKHRRNRRGRTRYRKPRFLNRKKKEIMPSVEHKADAQIKLVERYAAVLPKTKVHVERANFDTHLLKCLEEGKKVPVGNDYQRGDKYGYETTRLAVMGRDDYTCQVCHGKSGDKRLRLHHIDMSRKRGNRVDDLITICETCHSPSNHKTILKDLKRPKRFDLSDATQMNHIGKYIARVLREEDGFDVVETYGAFTNMVRKELGLLKSHVNDAYSMGDYHPPVRACFCHLKKARRQSRAMTKFYDSRVVDVRDGKVKSGSELSCNRTSRHIPRDNPQNLRKFRGEKVRKGYVTAPKAKYDIRPGDIVEYDGKLYACYGVHNKGTRVIIDKVDGKQVSVSIKKVHIRNHHNGWTRAKLGYIKDACK